MKLEIKEEIERKLKEQVEKMNEEKCGLKQGEKYIIIGRGGNPHIKKIKEEIKIDEILKNFERNIKPK